MGGEVNESKMCGSERRESEKGDGIYIYMECAEVVLRHQLDVHLHPCRCHHTGPLV
jgi:hypothetical protein